MNFFKEKDKTKYESIYISTDNESGKELKPLEIHLNFWLLSGNKNIGEDFLDIGILIKEFENVDFLRLFFPSSEIQLECISDRLFRKEVAVAIFNDEVTLNHGENDKLASIQKSKDKEPIWVYNTVIGTDIINQNSNQGTLFQVDLKNIASNTNKTGKLYLRYRIKGNYIKALTQTKKRGNLPFESVHTSTRILDFRLNKSRSINPSIKEIGKNPCKDLSKIHFLLVVPAEDEYHSASEELKSTRNLEHSLWDDYLSASGKNKGLNQKLYTVYHWKKEQDNIDDFNIYAKFKTSEIGWKSLVLYVFVILVLGMLSNFLFSIAQTECKALYAKYNNEIKVENSQSE